MENEVLRHFELAFSDKENIQIEEEINRITLAVNEIENEILMIIENDEILRDLIKQRDNLIKIHKEDPKRRSKRPHCDPSIRRINRQINHIHKNNGVSDLHKKKHLLGRKRIRARLILQNRNLDGRSTQPVLDEPEETDDISEEITALRRIRQEATLSICKIQSVEETLCGWASRKHQSEPEKCEETYTLIPIDEW